MTITKIRPNAILNQSWGTDGRDSYYYISYTCPKCNKHIKEYDIACTECGTFFDWTSEARIDYTPHIKWE